MVDTSSENCARLAGHCRVWRSAEADEAADLIQALANKLNQARRVALIFVTYLFIVVVFLSSIIIGKAHADELKIGTSNNDLVFKTVDNSWSLYTVTMSGSVNVIRDLPKNVCEAISASIRNASLRTTSQMDFSITSFVVEFGCFESKERGK